MKNPTLEQIDRIRINKFRPTVVACIIHNKKILFAHKGEYDVWMFPQGGIDNGELAEESLVRELREEMGEELIDKVYVDSAYFGEDRVEFSRSKHNVRKLFTDLGEQVDMFGKHYYLYIVNFNDDKLTNDKSEFDKYAWTNYAESDPIMRQIYHKNKKLIMKKILYLLHKDGIID